MKNLDQIKHLLHLVKILVGSFLVMYVRILFVRILFAKIRRVFSAMVVTNGFI